MLKLNGHSLYWDLEIPILENHKVVCCCDNPYYKGNLYNIQQTTLIDLDKLDRNIDIVLSVPQWRGLIRKWIDNKEWEDTYIQCVIDQSKAMGNSTYTSFNCIFREKQQYLLSNLSPLVEECPIIYSHLETEYSVKVQDFLQLGYGSIYYNDVMTQVEVNKSKINEFNKCTEFFDVLNIPPFSDFKSITDLSYLYFPLSAERVKTNYIWIKKCLEDKIANSVHYS